VPAARRLAERAKDADVVIGAGDFASFHLGSSARSRPSGRWLAVCGHIHQCWGHEARIGPTRVINVGPDGVVLEV
jgi:Icc-related predicted phosphoesterase